MSIFLSDIDKEIRNSLQIRQNLNNSRTQTGWFMDKQPWVRMTSMAGVFDDPSKLDWHDDELRIKWRLFGGVYGYKGNNQMSSIYASGFKEMYNMNSYYYNNDKLLTFDPTKMINNPIPGITDVQVTNKGQMGSIKEATIKFTCWDLNQLDVLENLYMTPGLSILLEWGWNKDISGNNITTNLSTQAPMHDYCLVKKVTKLIKDSDGHYGAIQGRVVNFGWNYRTSGGFDCSVTITSMAEAFLNANIHSKSQNLPPIGTKTKEDGETSSDAKIEENILYRIMAGLQYLESQNTIYNDDNTIAGIRIAGNKLGLDRNHFGGRGNKVAILVSDPSDDNSEWWNETLVDPTDGASYYVTFKYFLHMLNQSLSFIQSKNTKNGDCIDENIATDSSGRIIAPTFKNNDIELINYIPNLLSADPWVCMLTTPLFNPGNTNEHVIKGYSSSPANESNYYKVFPELKQFSRAPNTSKNKIDLNTFLINLKFIYECYKATQTVNEFVLKILNGVSEVCGNMWEFELMIDSDNSPNLIQIVDTKTVVDELPVPFMFETGKVNSVITAMSMETEADNDLKVQGMYGTNKSKASDNVQSNIDSKNKFIGYNLFGKNIVNLAEENIEPIGPNDIITIKTFNEPDLDKRKKIIQDYKDMKTDQGADFILTQLHNLSFHDPNLDKIQTVISSEFDIIDDYFTAITEPYYQRTPTNTQLAINSVNKFVNEIIFSKNPNGKIEVQPQHALPLLPLRLSLTIDGIHGLRCGNCINVDYKPLRYSGDRTYFQITNITHNISGAHWYTTLETIMRVNMDKVVPTVTSINTNQNPQVITNAEVIVSKATVKQGQIAQHGKTWSSQQDINISWLHPDIRKNVTDIMNKLSNTYHINTSIKSGWRSTESQKKLYGKGKTVNTLLSAGYTTEDANKYSKPNDPHAKDCALPGTSAHEWGLAMDLWPAGTNDANDSRFATIAEVCKQYGFTGDRDPWHWQKLPIPAKTIRFRISNNMVDESGYVKLK